MLKQVKQQMGLVGVVLMSVACTINTPSEIALKNQLLLTQLKAELSDLKSNLNQKQEEQPLQLNDASELDQIPNAAPLLRNGFSLQTQDTEATMKIFAASTDPAETPSSGGPVVSPSVTNPAPPSNPDSSVQAIKAQIESLAIGMWIDKPAKLTDKFSTENTHGFIKIKKKIDATTPILNELVFKSTNFPKLITTLTRNHERNGYVFRLHIEGRLVSVDHKDSLETGLIEEIVIDPLIYGCKYQKLDAAGKAVGEPISWGYNYFSHQPVYENVNPSFFQD